MSDEKPTIRERIAESNPIHAAIVGAIVAYLGNNGIEGIANRVWPPITPIVQNIAVETAKQNEKLDAIQRSVDRLWQIKVARTNAP